MGVEDSFPKGQVEVKENQLTFVTQFINTIENTIMKIFCKDLTSDMEHYLTDVRGEENSYQGTFLESFLVVYHGE